MAVTTESLTAQELLEEAKMLSSDNLRWLRGQLDRLLESEPKQGWQQKWEALCQQVHRDGGLQVGDTTEEIVEKMRQTRHEIFEAEYAHLYR
jgi:hypothetical protein